MTDIAIELDTSGSFLDADLVIEGNDLKIDESLETAVIVSIFSDARVTKEELGSPANDDASLRGWWGDMFPPVENDVVLGSKFWLLQRGKITRQVLLSVQQSMKEALQWMIEDDIAETVEVLVERDSRNIGQVNIGVFITRKFVDPTLYDFIWDGQRLKRGFGHAVFTPNPN